MVINHLLNGMILQVGVWHVTFLDSHFFGLKAAEGQHFFKGWCGKHWFGTGRKVKLFEMYDLYLYMAILRRGLVLLQKK